MSLSPLSTNDLIEAYRLIQAGKRRAARKILKPLLQSHPRSERTWMLFSYAVLDPAIQRDCLQRVLEINPNNVEARRRLAELDAAPSPDPTETPPEPPQLSPALPAWLVDKTSPPTVAESDLAVEAPVDVSAPEAEPVAASEPVAAVATPAEAAPAEAEGEPAPPVTQIVAPEPATVAETPVESAPVESEAAPVPAVTESARPEPDTAAEMRDEPEPPAQAPTEAFPVEAEAEPARVAAETAPSPVAPGPDEAVALPVEPAPIEPAPGLPDRVERPEGAVAGAHQAPTSPPPASSGTEVRVTPPGRAEYKPPTRRRPTSAGLLPNTLVRGRYRIMGEIGAGASSVVYRAFDESEGLDVALKVVAEPTPAMEREFRRQADLLLPLRHPNLPRYRDYFVIPGHALYLVMDFVPGDNIERVLEREGVFSEADVLHWAPRVLDALHYLHSQVPPLIHADAKPANIRFAPDGRVLLVDYGLGRAEPLDDFEDPRADIYLFGATLYTALTGRPPEPGRERSEGRTVLTPVQRRRPEISVRLAQAVERALSLNPEDRFETAIEFAEALPLPESVKADREDEIEEPPSNRTWLMWLALGLLALGLVAVFAAIWVMGGLGARPTPAPPGSPTLAPVWATATALQAAALITPSATPTPFNTPTPTAAVTPSATATPRATPLGGGMSGRIAFVSERTGKPQIFLMNVDGTNPTALTNLPDGACQPAWSPDGKQLVFISPCARRAETYPGAALYLMNADGSDVKQLVSLAGGVFDPDWSPSGLTFTVLQNNRPQVYVAAPDGSNPQRLSPPVAFDRHPTWSPDGARLLFLNNTRAGRPTLYWMNKDGTFEDGRNPRQVTRDLDADSPAWSPDGRLVAFVSQNNLFTVPWDGLGFGVRAVRTEGLNDEPAWSPDGQWLVYESWLEFGERDIFRLPAAGGPPVQLTTDPAPDYHPAWQP